MNMVRYAFPLARDTYLEKVVAIPRTLRRPQYTRNSPPPSSPFPQQTAPSQKHTRITTAPCHRNAAEVPSQRWLRPGSCPLRVRIWYATSTTQRWPPTRYLRGHPAGAKQTQQPEVLHPRMPRQTVLPVGITSIRPASCSSTLQESIPRYTAELSVWKGAARPTWTQ